MMVPMMRITLYAALVAAVTLSDTARAEDGSADTTTSTARKTTNTLIAPPRRDVPGTLLPGRAAAPGIQRPFDFPRMET